MRNAVVFVNRNLHDILHGVFLALADRFRDFRGFADADAHMPVAVAYDYQSRKPHGASALHGFGYTLDSYYFIV